MSAVIEALKAYGVAEQEIQTSRMNVSEIRSRDRDRELVAYRATTKKLKTPLNKRLKADGLLTYEKQEEERYC